MQLIYRLHPQVVLRTLGAIALLLALLSVSSEYLIVEVLDSETQRYTIDTLDLLSVNLEESLPTWYASCLLLGAALLLLLVASGKRAQGDRSAFGWWGLALIFLYLSIDEGAAIHETLSNPLQTLFNTSGYLAFGWLLAGVPLVLLFALAYLRFWLRLPPDTRALFLLAALLYVGGAVVVEAISANRWAADTELSFTYLAIATLEELMEMLGAITMIYALLRYLRAMQYSALITPSPLHELSAQSALPAGFSPRRWLLTMGLVLAVLVAGIALAVLRIEPSSSPPAGDLEVAVQELSLDHLTVLESNSLFDIQNPADLRLADMLLAQHPQVMVIGFPAADSSLFLAGEAMPFNQQQLASFFQEQGIHQFVIFETAILQAFVQNLQ